MRLPRDFAQSGGVPAVFVDAAVAGEVNILHGVNTLRREEKFNLTGANRANGEIFNNTLFSAFVVSCKRSWFEETRQSVNIELVK